MGRKEREIDFLETLIPELAENATKKAYLAALSRGDSVLEIVDGNLVLTAPDGTRTIIKKAKPLVSVQKHG